MIKREFSLVSTEHTEELHLLAATETPVQRGDYLEVLLCRPENVVIAARSLLLNHSPNQILGRVDRIEIRDEKIYAYAKFASTDRAKEFAQLVRDGALRGVSVGYTIEETRIEGNILYATRWTLREISLTPIPADLSAEVLQRIFSSTPQTLINSNKGDKMDIQDIETNKIRAEVLNDEKEKAFDAFYKDLSQGRRLSSLFSAYRSTFNWGTDFAEAQESLESSFKNFDSKKLNKRAVLVSSSFGNLTALAATKAMVDAYKRYTPEYPKWTKEIFVPDFNTVTIAGVTFSNFVPQPSEGADYPDATQSVVGGSGSNQFLGQNVEISLQAIYNDRTGQLLDYFAAIGRTAARTLDEITQTALAGATWTGATTNLAFSEANLATGYGLHAGVTIPGIPARVLIVPMPLFVEAKNATTFAPGAEAGRILAEEAEGLTVVRGWYLSDQNDWYLCADPADAPVVVLLRHPDYIEPRVVQKGEGGGPNLLMRVDFPARAVVLYRTNNQPLAAHRFTAP